MLQYFFESKDQIPSGLEQYYKEKSVSGVDGWYLDAEAPPLMKKALDSERDQRQEFEKKAKGAQAQLDEFIKVGTVDQILGFKKAAEEKPDAKATQEEVERQVELKVQDRISQMVNTHKAEISERDERIDKQAEEIRSLVIDNTLQELCSKERVVPTATRDVLFRARQEFRVVDGKAVPHNEKGNPVYGSDGSSFMSPEEWLKTQRRESPHWFAKNDGGGAGQTPGATPKTDVSNFNNNPGGRPAAGQENQGTVSTVGRGLARMKAHDAKKEG